MNFSFPNSPPLFNTLSFVFKRKGIYFLTGRSGTGKSTLLRCISLIVGRTEQAILLDGSQVDPDNIAEFRSKVIYLPQRIPANSYKLHDFFNEPFKFAVNTKKKKPSEEILLSVLKEVDLQEIPLDRSFNDLSGGQKQRVSLARAFLLEPEFLLCDEIVAGLDQESVQIISSALVKRRDSGLGIIFTSHQNFIEADDVITLELKNQKLLSYATR